MPRVYLVRADWDAEAGVWVASSDDVAGLATEAETIEALSQKLDRMVPELLAINGQEGEEVAMVELLARRFSTSPVALPVIGG